MNLTEWMEKNTYHHSCFWDVEELVRKKNRQNLRIALAFPTLNEEPTIGKEVLVAKGEKERTTDLRGDPMQQPGE